MNPQNAPADSSASDAQRELRRHEAALERCNQAIAHHPDDAEAYKNRGNALLALKQHDAAIQSYGRAILLKPDYADAYYNRGNVLNDVGQHDAAVQSFDRAIALNPDDAEAYNNRGIALQALKRHEAAIQSFDRAVTLNPGYADAFNNRGNVLKELGRYDEALASYGRALAIRPDYAEVFCNRGNALQALKRHGEALACYDQALAINPDFAEAFCNRGNALQELKRHDEALACYGQALAIKPDFAEALSNCGNALKDLKRYEEAMASYDKALAIKPDYAEALSNRSLVLQQLKRYHEALASCDKALSIRPDFAEALGNRGNAQHELKRYHEALASYDRALAIKPDFAQALGNRGNVLNDLGRYEEALASYDQALAIKPGFTEALINRGVALQNLKRLDEALESYAQALTIKPDYEYLQGVWLHTKMRICAWQDAESQFSLLLGRIERNEKATLPFPVLAMTDCLPVQRKAAEIWVNAQHPARPALPAFAKRARQEKIRIGYYSANYHNHAVAYLMAELFERHDKNRFVLVAFSFGPDQKDEMRRRVSAAFDEFIDVRNQSDKDIALLSRKLGIDIAVDLMGLTQDMRVGIFSYRAAPLQVSYLGYPGTMGAQYMDYLIADRTLIPESSRLHYSEKIAYLPNSYQVNDRKRAVANKTFSREAQGLPDTGFVFCCFNNNYKITPATFDGWMRILKRVEGSVLWLIEDNPVAARNLRQEAGARGIDAARLIFARRMPPPEHLARHRLAGLFLDTLPYNAHTTASDALWAGLPVLTCTGAAFASRVAASLLNAIGLPELITSTQEQYETLAVELATNPERLMQLRQQLERNRLRTPLFDTALFTEHLEAAYTQMHERYQSGLPPEHIHVRPVTPSPGDAGNIC